MTEAQFWSRVDKTTTCWLWRGALNTRGYGHVRVGTRYPMAHRVSYAALRGPIPAGLTLDHLCGTKRCVNPDHLEPVTRRENQRRAYALIVACPRGHAYDEANSYFTPSGYRRCRTCHRERRHEA